jgi:hypothetical protein
LSLFFNPVFWKTFFFVTIFQPCFLEHVFEEVTFQRTGFFSRLIRVSTIIRHTTGAARH